ncbi:MAG: electron transport complex subunit RsxC [Cycloclasticus sp. symbiont of Poecilosclerida sp. M]|nr:MAG: electron transport complex subunit RsxC [Cycloclasticus sp. symbiont of Poecilosclerida sp. M]
MRLWRFNGGLPSLAEHKNESSHLPIEAAPIPSELVYPLRQHIGNAAKPLVKAGEKVLRGQKIADAHGLISAPIHAASSGVVADISDKLIPHPSGFSAPCITIKTDGLDNAVTPTPLADYRQASIQELIDTVREAGIVGLGGAAFPTAMKLDNQSVVRDIKTLILNGAECEPYISCDDRLLKERAKQVIKGAEILLFMLGAKEAFIAIEDNAPETYQAVQLALKEHANSIIKAAQIPTIYPTGGEKQLIKTLTGKEVPPGDIPANIGIVSINVGTVYAVQQAIEEGLPLTSRIATVTGEGVTTPRNVEVRIGTPINTLIEFCDGYSNTVERLIMGGPMMGFALLNDEIPIVKASNCILVASKQEVITEKKAMPCIRCGLCASACPANLLPQQLYWHSRSDQFDKVEGLNLFDCIECGCCDVVCPSHIPLVQHFRYAKSAIKVKNHEKHQSNVARDRFEARETRLARDKAERAERSRKKKAALKGGSAKEEVAAAIKRSNEKKQQSSAETTK